MGRFIGRRTDSQSSSDEGAQGGIETRSNDQDDEILININRQLDR